jgi:hypothetical protein
LIEAARHVLQAREEAGRDGYVEEWRALLDLGHAEVARRLPLRTEEMALLRSCSPFSVAKGVDFRDPAWRVRARRKAKLQEGDDPLARVGAISASELR